MGGNPISNIWCSVRKDKNVNVDPDKRPEVVHDFLVWRVGYADQDLKKGDTIYIKRSDAKRLLGLLKYGAGE